MAVELVSIDLNQGVNLLRLMMPLLDTVHMSRLSYQDPRIASQVEILF